MDTGDATPVCCRYPRYGPYDWEVIKGLSDVLHANDMVEDDDGPWGAQVVLAIKGGQENQAWFDVLWRLCVSFRKLNQVTRPFKFPIRRCEDAILHIGKAAFRITIDMDSGYWQVPVEERSRPKLAFFGAGEKLRFTCMAMGVLNAAPFCRNDGVPTENWR